MPSSTPRIVYLANRQIGLRCLRLLLDAGITPVALVVPSRETAEATGDMRNLLPGIPFFEGKDACMESIDQLRDLRPDYLLSVHFPMIMPEALLQIPSRGTLNLHPSFLPFNRGWNTPSWAILDGTPYGATLHWMDSGLDTGPIALQKRIAVLPIDTADTLYKRALAAEAEIFRDAIPLLKTGTLLRTPQEGKGTMHKKADLESLRRLEPDTMSGEELFRRVRALSTNNPREEAFVEMNGKTYKLKLDIRENP